MTEEELLPAASPTRWGHWGGGRPQQVVGRETSGAASRHLRAPPHGTCAVCHLGGCPTSPQPPSLAVSLPGQVILNRAQVYAIKLTLSYNSTKKE